MLEADNDVFGLYLRDLRRVVFLDEAEVVRLIGCAQAGDVGARNRVIEGYLPLVVAVARRFRRSSSSLADCVQAGNLGLFRAVMGWKPAGGMSFVGYAVRWIRTAMVRGAERYEVAFSVPDYLFELSRRVRRAEAQLAAAGEPLVVGAVLGAARVTDSELSRVRLAMRRAVSLEASLDGDGEMTVGSRLVSPVCEVVLPDASSSRLAALPGWCQLTGREREILCRRYGVGGDVWSVERLVRHFGLSGERIRVIEKRAMAKLRLHGMGVGGAS